MGWRYRLCLEQWLEEPQGRKGKAECTACFLLEIIKGMLGVLCIK